MNLWLRMLCVYIRALFQPKLTGWDARSLIDLRVSLGDLDTNFHMNNGRYLTVMDLGRFDLLLRSGLWALVRKTGSVPILAAAQIRYRRPLNYRQRFTLTTQVIGWDSRWMFLEQRFIFRDGPSVGQVAAIGLVKASFYEPALKRTMPTEEIIQAMGGEIHFPDLPEAVVSWMKAEDDLRKTTALQP